MAPDIKFDKNLGESRLCLSLVKTQVNNKKEKILI